ncbi:DnaJ domain-containing protein [Lebetimonas sp. JS138]|uniref:DnaJ domain-containing protein n=1 Tax=Lebetimonas sp. JS138 TaxID=990072 RepID=UPI0004676433|nr:DnaJ domain-containing protein [Lebetimonas sp. JS138]
MDDRIFEIKIADNIEVVIDSRFNIKGFIEFIRLSFNKLEIKENIYKIYFDKNNIEKHKLLINAIGNMYKKRKDFNKATYKKLILNFKKDCIVKIKKYQVLFDEKAVYITVRKISSKEFEILFANPKEKVFNYIKGIFLFDILDFGKEKIIVSLNGESKRLVSALISKHSIMGYKVEFRVKKEEFESTESFNVEGSLKEYLTKIKNALELFGVDNIYEWNKIKKEYRRLAKKYHPDLHRTKPELIRKIYDKKFRRVKESYELLEEYYNNRASR